MNRQTVKSSHIASAGFEPASRVMECEFARDGRIYQYPNISAPQFLAFMSSPSKGQYFRKNFAHLPAKEVTPPTQKAAAYAKPSFGKENS